MFSLLQISELLAFEFYKDHKACLASQGLGKPDYSGKLFFGVGLISLFAKLETILGLSKTHFMLSKKGKKTTGLACCLAKLLLVNKKIK